MFRATASPYTRDVRVTMRHVFDFEGDRDLIGPNLVRPAAWDAARDTSGPFGLPNSRRAWESAAGNPRLAQRAADVVTVAQRIGARTLCSHGVGTGTLELNIHRIAPELKLICTDYAPRATQRLAELFPEAEVVVHDLAVDMPPEADLHLMHRIDTELDTTTWRKVVSRYCEPILFVPVLLLDAERMLKELYRRFVGVQTSRAGWVRTEDALRSLWDSTHEDEPVTIGDQRAFLLSRRQA
jgi:hypothetical protein